MKVGKGASEVAQRIEMLTTKPGHLNSVLRTHKVET